MTALLALVLFPALLNAATFTAIASGSWSSSATWAGGIAPGTTISGSDQVYIGAGFNVTANTDIVVDGALAILDVDGTLDAGANAVAVASGTVSGTGNVIANEVSLASSAILAFAGSIDAEAFVNNGAAVALDAATTVGSELQLNGGSIVIGSGIDLESGTEIIVNGGTLSLSGGVFTATESYTVTYEGSNASAGLELSGSGLAGVELNLDNASSEVTLGGNAEVNGDLTITQGTLVIGNNSLTVNGVIDASTNGSIDASAGSSLSVSTNGSGEIDLSFADSPETIGTLSIGAGSNASAELNGDLLVMSEFDLISGTFSLNGNSLSVSGDFTGNGEFEASTGSDFSISGNGSVTGGLILAAGGQSMGDVTIDLTNGQSIEFGGNGIVSGSFDFQNGTIDLQSGSSLILDGSAAFGASAEFDGDATADLSISTSTSATGEISFSNGSATVGNLTVDIDGNGSVSLGSDLGVDGELSLANGSLDVNGNTLMINGDIAAGSSGSISVDSSSDIEINASGNLSGDLTFTSGSSTAGNVVIDISGNGSVSLGSDLGIDGEIDLANGSLDVNGNTLIINGDIAAGGSGSISVDSSSDIEIHANGDLNGELSFTAGNSTMGDLVIDIDNDGSVMLGSDAGVSGTLDLQNGFIAIGGSDLMVSGNVNGGTDGSYVVTTGQGSLMLDVAAATEAFFAVGTEASYAPATLLQASGSGSGMFGVSVANDVYAAGMAGTDMSTWGPMVDHTWNITSELSSSIDLTMTLEWDAAAEVNAFDRTDAYISHYVNAAWDMTATASATLNASGRYELSRSGVTSLSPFAVFDGATAVGIDESEELTVSFFPNPAVDVVTYTLGGQNGNTFIDWIDASGKVVASEIVQGTRGTMDVSALSAGIYTVRITNEESVATARMVKQ